MGKKREKIEFKIPPEVYNKILGSLKLKNLSLIEANAKIKPFLKGFEKLEININDDAIYKIKNNEIIVLHTYNINAIPLNKKQNIISISATFALHFAYHEKFTDDFFEIYKEMSLPLNTWPFMREFVNSMTARMNIPPLTLPLLKRDLQQ